MNDDLTKKLHDRLQHELNLARDITPRKAKRPVVLVAPMTFHECRTVITGLRLILLAQAVMKVKAKKGIAIERK